MGEGSRNSVLKTDAEKVSNARQGDDVTRRALWRFATSSWCLS